MGGLLTPRPHGPPVALGSPKPPGDFPLPEAVVLFTGLLPFTALFFAGYLVWWLLWGKWHPAPKPGPGHVFPTSHGWTDWVDPRGVTMTLGGTFVAQGAVWHRDGLGQLYMLCDDGEWRRAP